MSAFEKPQNEWTVNDAEEVIRELRTYESAVNCGLEDDWLVAREIITAELYDAYH